MIESIDTLRSRLAYEPKELQFGTSGRRGEVVDLTQLEIYLNVLGELRYLQSIAAAEGGIVAGEEFYFATDLRPSSTAFVVEERGYGEICQAVERAVLVAGMLPVFLGKIPTPALAAYAFARGKGSIMVTGSHIPFSRNGYKLNTSTGELLKEHEAPINASVARVREELYGQGFSDSLFDERGLFKTGHAELPAVVAAAQADYMDRYLKFFGGAPLAGKRIVAYQHSAVGRDVLVEILQRLGAEVIAAGRSETFIPIDTENIDQAQLAAIQVLADEARAAHGELFAVVSTDGDSDRPLILGFHGTTTALRFFGGDLVGMVVAEYLGADAVVVPISCNDAIDLGKLAPMLEPKTRIGSPFVIAGMKRARGEGKRVVCGWEANGGFLTGSDIARDGQVLTALPTRDALLPILTVLVSACERGVALAELFEELPKRFSKAALLKKFPRPVSLRIMRQFSPEVWSPEEMDRIKSDLAEFFPAELGFGEIVRLDYTDGVRVIFSNGDIAHIRPSGNADELRIYGVADTQERADAIAAMGVAEPDGILRRMERSLA